MILITWISYACFFCYIFTSVCSFSFLDLFVNFNRRAYSWNHSASTHLKISVSVLTCFLWSLSGAVESHQLMDSVICLAFHIQSLTQSDWLSFFLHNIHVLVQDSLCLFNKILKKQILSLLRMIWMWFFSFIIYKKMSLQ